MGQLIKNPHAKARQLIAQASKVYQKENLNHEQTKASDYLASELKITPQEARELIINKSSQFEGLLNEIKKRLDFTNLRLIEKLQQGVADKVDHGSMEQARAGALAIAILYDKIFGTPQTNQVNIAGQKVNINMGWRFSPFKKDNQ